MNSDDSVECTVGAAQQLGSAIEQVVRAVVQHAISAVVASLPVPPPPLVTDAVLRVDEVATIVQVKPQTVRDWIRAGSLRACHIGSSGTRRVYRIRREDLDAFLSAASCPVDDVSERAAAIVGRGAVRRGAVRRGCRGKA
jgi:excisionase family DNA binding protein